MTDNSTREIPLTKGKVALVDAEDFEWLNQWKWNSDAKGYARRESLMSENPNHPKKILVLMHRQIINVLPCVEVDHINCNGSDNRRMNLRICTHAENMRNMQKHSDGLGLVKGVYFDPRPKLKKHFRPRIMVNGKYIYRGRYATLEEAALVYNELAIEYHGAFARLNTF